MLTLCAAFERGSWDELNQLCITQNIDFFVVEEIFLRGQEYSTAQIKATT